MLKYRIYQGNESLNSSIKSYSSYNKNIFHMEIVEAVNPCTLIAGLRVISLDKEDIVITRHFKNIQIKSHHSGIVLRLIAIDLEYPAPLNQYLVADNPLIHDFMNDKKADISYICFRNLKAGLCKSYVNILRILSKEKRDSYNNFQAQRVAGLLFTELLHNHRDKISKADSDFPSTRVKYASKDTQSGSIMAYIISKNGNVSLAEVANHFGYQKNYLSRLCRKLFELDFIHLRINIRMNLANNQLKLTTKSIEEIAAELGYKEVSTFSKQFSQYYKLSPIEFRKKYAVYYK